MADDKISKQNDENSDQSPLMKHKILVSIIVTIILTLSFQYVDRIQEFGEDAYNYKDYSAEPSEILVINSTPPSTFYMTSEIEIVWGSDKPFKLILFWDDLIGVNSELTIPANTWYVSLSNETNSYKQLKRGWNTVLPTWRSDDERIQLYFKWIVPEIIPDQTYVMFYKWSPVPVRTAQEYAIEHLFEPFSFTFWSMIIGIFLGTGKFITIIEEKKEKLKKKNNKLRTGRR